ncbi:hypothetical protein Hanom_Chr10g00882031 [Helianthus anomalus]
MDPIGGDLSIRLYLIGSIPVNTTKEHWFCLVHVNYCMSYEDYKTLWQTILKRIIPFIYFFILFF